MNELIKLRAEIDEADELLLRAFIKRMDTVEKIGKIKKESGLDIQDKTRETQVLSDITKRTPEKYRESVMQLYECIFNVSKSYQLKTD